MDSSKSDKKKVTRYVICKHRCTKCFEHFLLWVNDINVTVQMAEQIKEISVTNYGV